MFPVPLSLLTFAFAIAQISAHQKICKCVPGNACWPSTATWNALNQSLAGNLIKTIPPAAACYPGPEQNADVCASVDAQWGNSTFHANDPTSIDYPELAGSPCLPINASAGQKAVGTCGLGGYPVYTVNAIDVTDISKGIDFARRYNIRLVVKNTGHDLLGRSNGYGSLNIWMRHLRQGVTFQDIYQSKPRCSKTDWQGSAFVIGGGYTWNDIYGEAADRGVIVVGGGDPTVACLGGWMQGGGHSPATHDYGLGADQVLEAQVVLANGTLVTASPCENPDLFFAIRGGGGGTYGVVVSTTIKAYPTTNGVSQTLAIIPLSNSDNDTNAFFDVITLLYSEFPALSDQGYSGYGSWTMHGYQPIAGNSTSGYVHAIAIFGNSLPTAAELFASTAAKLSQWNSTSLSVTITYTSFATYADYYGPQSNHQAPVATNGAIGSRFLDRSALVSQPSKLKQTLQIIAGTASQGTSINVIFVGGGQVAKDRSDIYSGVNPAWRDAYVHNVVARGWADGTDAATIAGIRNDITNNKVQAMKDLAPNTGCYMNEADRFDPDYQVDFYGAHFGRLSAIKDMYDPHHVFYCPTCVGSERWTELPNGTLCMA